MPIMKIHINVSKIVKMEFNHTIQLMYVGKVVAKIFHSSIKTQKNVMIFVIKMKIMLMFIQIMKLVYA